MKWRCLPVSAGLFLKQRVKLLHFAGWNEEEGQVTVGHTDSLDQPVQRSLCVTADLRRRAPEYDGRALWAIEELGRFANHPEYAGMSHDAHAGPVPHVRFVASGRGIVHADDALRTVDLVSGVSPQHVTRAGH